MKKEQLTALGLSEEISEKVLGIHKDTLKDFIPKHRFDEVTAEKTNLTSQLSAANTQIEQLKKFEGTNQELTAKIEKYQQDATAKETQYKESLAKMAKTNLIRVSLLSSDKRPYDVDIVSSLIDVEKVVLDGKSEKIVSGLDEQLEQLKKDKAFLFSPGAGNPNPKGNPPPEGNPNPQPESEAASFGKRLALAKNKSMGIVKKEDK